MNDADRQDFLAFMRESWLFSAQVDAPSTEALQAAESFCDKEELCVEDVVELGRVFVPTCRLRERVGHNMTVGEYRPPNGGPVIRRELEELLKDKCEALELMLRFLALHPLSDGNGRVARTLWAWKMLRTEHGLATAFSISIYYQIILQHQGGRHA